MTVESDRGVEGPVEGLDASLDAIPSTPSASAPLSAYQDVEFEQRLSALRGNRDARWWAEYALKLCAHELWGDALEAALETNSTEWDVKPVVSALQANKVPPHVSGTALEPLAGLVAECIGARLARYWTLYKRLPSSEAQIFGDHPLDGWYTRCGDSDGSDLVAVDRPAPRINEIDLLVRAAAAVRPGAN